MWLSWPRAETQDRFIKESGSSAKSTVYTEAQWIAHYGLNELTGKLYNLLCKKIKKQQQQQKKKIHQQRQD